MRKTILTIAVVFAALTFLAACKPVAQFELTETDSGRTIEINKDATVTIKLSSNPSTGYAWTVAAVDGTILQQQGDKIYDQGNTAPNVVGAGGTETFTFKGLAAGQSALQLVYSRSWETGVPPIQTFEITIDVK